jgi:glycosyltransferase involved in cell wall biosynthesis
MIYHLENLGVESDLYLCGRTQWPSAKAAKEVIAKHFFPLKGEMRLLDSSNINDYGKEYDLAVATSWYTAYYVRGFGLCRKKAYFVQDYEPYFFAKGSECQFAEQTYKFGFYGITAGDWLRETLIQKYGMDCASFKFSYDRHLYRFHERENDGVKRVFFYARPLSARRGFELGMLALNRLCQRNPTVEVILAGADVSRYSIPFKHSNPGVVSLQNLSDIYGKCDLALVLSFTNLSLLPLEILASGCPVLLNKGRNNSWIDENEIFLYTDPDIDSLVENMEAVLKGKIDARPYVERARKYLTTSSWEKEAETVRDIIGRLFT